jgi:hypothetical protein
MKLQQLPQELIDKIILPKYLYLDNNITLKEKIDLCLIYNKLDLVKSQINYLVKEFDYLKNVPNNYWEPYKYKPSYIFILKNNTWKRKY